LFLESELQRVEQFLDTHITSTTHSNASTAPNSGHNSHANSSMSITTSSSVGDSPYVFKTSSNLNNTSFSGDYNLSEWDPSDLLHTPNSVVNHTALQRALSDDEEEEQGEEGVDKHTKYDIFGELLM
jgi:hypothetical protein